MIQRSPTELIVVRHGQTEWNSQRRMQGHLDSDLTPLGRRQAQAIADHLAKQQNLHALYSSDLGRALNTAKAIAEKCSLEILTDPRLRERNLGIFQGLTVDEIRTRYPDHYARFLTHDPDYLVPDGESIRQRHDRIIRSVADIAARHPGQRIIVVTHGGALSSLYRHTTGLPLNAPRNFTLLNASINTFTLRNGTPHLADWSFTDHLAAIPTDDDY